MLRSIELKYFCAVQLLFVSLSVEMVLGQQSLETYPSQPSTRSRSRSTENFPDYTQPTTRYVTSGEALKRTRKFNLGEQMKRESLGVFSR